MSKLERLKDALLLILCVFISSYNLFPFPYKVPIIAVLIISYFAFYRRDLSLIGFKKLNKKALIYALIASLVMVLVVGKIISPLLELIFGELNTAAYGALEGNLSFVLDYWYKAMISAAFSEEVFYRGLGLFVLCVNIPFKKYKALVASLLLSLFFAFSHSFQGEVGLISTFLASMIFCGLYFLSGRNIWSVIICHALVDSWALFSLYHGGIDLW